MIDIDATQQILTTASATRDKFEQCHTVGLDVLRSWTPVPAIQR